MYEYQVSWSNPFTVYNVLTIHPWIPFLNLSIESKTWRKLGFLSKKCGGRNYLRKWQNEIFTTICSLAVQWNLPHLSLKYIYNIVKMYNNALCWFIVGGLLIQFSFVSPKLKLIYFFSYYLLFSKYCMHFWQTFDCFFKISLLLNAFFLFSF